MTSRSLDGIPPLVRFIIANALVGVLAGCVVAAALIASPGIGIGRLLATSSNPWLAGVLFFSGFIVTFGSLSAGAAIMLSGRPKPPSDE